MRWPLSGMVGASIALVLLSVGCSSTPDVDPPAKLEALQSAAPVRVLWSQNLWSKLKGHDLRFAPLLHGDQLFVADNKGQVRCLNAQNGRIVWEVKTGLRIASGPSLGAGDGWHAERQASGDGGARSEFQKMATTHFGISGLTSRKAVVRGCRGNAGARLKPGAGMSGYSILMFAILISSAICLVSVSRKASNSSMVETTGAEPASRNFSFISSPAACLVISA